MKQLSLLPVKKKHTTRRSSFSDSWAIYVDGASRNNPGQAGAGVVIIKNDVLARKEGYYLGVKTNNQAEYLALLLGIFLLKKLSVNVDDSVDIFADSELLVKQLNGLYKVKNPILKTFYVCAQEAMSGLNVHVKHVMREDNQEADSMANLGIDTEKKVPSEFVKHMKRHDIIF